MREDETEYRQRRAALRARSRAKAEIATGLVILLVGVGVSVGSYFVAKSGHLGRHYLLFFTPVILGLVITVRGLRQFARSPKLPRIRKAAPHSELERGWYPDPEGSASERWFDGVGWSEHLREAP